MNPVFGPIFARARYAYDSYQDFWRLVELSGFRTCFVDEIDLQSDNLYVTTPVNGELRPHVTHRRTLGPQTARIIWWNLERPDADSTHATPLSQGGVAYQGIIDEIMQYVDEVWVSDRYYRSLDPRMRFVPLGSHPDLGLAGRERLPMEYNVAMMAAMNPRREGIAYELRKAGITLAPNAWGEARDTILRSTLAMLNIHQHENPMPIAEPLRIALAASYKMALISEALLDPWPLLPSDYLLCDLAYSSRLVRAVKFAPLELFAESLFQRLCVEHTFRRGVMEALT